MTLVKLPGSKYPQLKFALKFLLIGEIFVFGTSYIIYGACSRSQETRKFLYDSPYLRFVVLSYYKLGDYEGLKLLKAHDLATWAAQDKLAKQQQREQPQKQTETSK